MNRSNSSSSSSSNEGRVNGKVRKEKNKYDTRVRETKDGNRNIVVQEKHRQGGVF